MTIKENLDKFKKIQQSILEFLEKGDDIEESFQKLQKNIELPQNLYDITLLLHLIASIAENHFLEPNFYPKIEKLLLILKDKIIKNCTDSEIFDIFKNNKKVLLFLFEEKMIKMNNYIALEMQSKKYMAKKYPQYFFPEIKPYIKSKKERTDLSEYHLYFTANEFYKKDDFSGFMTVSQTIRNRDSEKKKARDDWSTKFSNEFHDDFYENRKIGQNTSQICQLIQKDHIDDFIKYVEQENYSLTSTVDAVYYETNSFLLNKPQITLIEYASFYGSIQIFKYLFKNGVKLTPSIWPYAIHSNNPELIHLLEENQIEPESYLNVYNEAIRCHHNDVANYINDNYLKDEADKNKEKETNEKKDDDDDYENEEDEDEETKDSFLASLESYNFEFITEETIDNSSFYNLCEYDYCTFVNILIQQRNVDVNETREKEVKYGWGETFTEEKYILHSAIERGNTNIIKILLSHKNLDLNCIKKFVAKKPKTKRNRSFMLDYYLGTEWLPWNDWNDNDNNEIFAEMTALNYAIEKENIEIINLLLTNQNLDINLMSKFSMESPEENYLLMTPLQAAIEKENNEIIKILLLNDNVDPNVISVALSNNPDGNGKHIQRRERTAFHIAVENENIEIVKLLLENKKVDVNINRTWFKYRDEHEEWSSGIDGHEKSALHIAIYKGNTEIAKLLLDDERTDVNLLSKSLKSDIYVNDADEWDDRRAPEEDPTFETSYLWADIPDKWVLRLDQNKSEKTPLFFAVEFGNKEIVDLLVMNDNVDVNLKSKFVKTEISKKEKKCEITEEEKTPLYFVIECGKTDLYNNIVLIELLLKNKEINIELPCKISKSTKQISDNNNNNNEEEEEEEAKDDNSAQVTVKDVTPLQIATKKGDHEAINLLNKYK